MNLVLAAEGNPLSFLTEFGVEWDMIISQGLMFVIVAFVLYRFAFKPVMKAADERRAVIEKGLQDSEAARKRLAESEQAASEKIDAAAREASELLAKTRDDAKAMLDRSAQEAATRAQDSMDSARREIEAEKAKMKAELKSELAEVVARAAESVLGKNLDDGLRGKIAADASAEISSEK